MTRPARAVRPRPQVPGAPAAGGERWLELQRQLLARFGEEAVRRAVAAAAERETQTAATAEVAARLQAAAGELLAVLVRLRPTRDGEDGEV